jgi:hypothetical protein
MTWKTINAVLNKPESKRFPDHILIENNKITDKQQIADKFNSYFGQIGSDMAASIPKGQDHSFKDYLYPEINTSFTFELIPEDLIKQVINGLKSKSSSSKDGISTIVLKKLEPLLSRSLALIINQSLKTGIFPEKLKLAKVIPVYKKNETFNVENYRPISILPAISKVFEKVVHLQIYSYFNQHKILSNSQYGFREEHSTEHALFEIVDRVSSALDGGLSPIAIFLDLSKAFDTINYDILLSKLEHYGFRGSTLGWLRSYLTNRSQYVAYDNVSSATLPVSLGVPQGSILGPLLFIIYTNDIQNSTDFFHFIIYADDTNLINSMVYHDYAVVHNELKKVYEWLCINGLSLNIPKTKLMIFHNKNKTVHDSENIKVNDKPIERVTNFNFLGVILNENLNWDSHVDSVCLRISRFIGVLNKLKHYIPIYILMTLYNSLILSRCTYGILAWGCNTTRIYKLQKKAIRIITNSKYNAHTEPLFKFLELLKIQDIYKMNSLKFYYKHCHNQLPHYLQQFFYHTCSDVHQHDTRSKNKIYITKTRTRLAEHALRYSSAKIINETSDGILSKINTHSLQGFLFYIRTIYINSYDFNCTVNNCYICHN